MKIRLEDVDNLKGKLESLKDLDFSQSCKDAATDIYNMGQTRTPKKTGELRLSMGVNQNGKNEYEVGYAKEYAPHVEYGHRIVRNGSQVGYVDGRFFLKAMVDEEKPKFEEYIRKQLEGVK